jgi:hypothetical protein
MWFSGFAVGGTGKRDTHTPFAEMCEDAAMKDLIVGVRQNEEE